MTPNIQITAALINASAESDSQPPPRKKLESACANSPEMASINGSRGSEIEAEMHDLVQEATAIILSAHNQVMKDNEKLRDRVEALTAQNIIIQGQAENAQQETERQRARYRRMETRADTYEREAQSLKTQLDRAAESDQLTKVAKELAAFDQSTGWMTMAAKMEELQKAVKELAKKQSLP